MPRDFKYSKLIRTGSSGSRIPRSCSTGLPLNGRAFDYFKDSIPSPISHAQLLQTDIFHHQVKGWRASSIFVDVCNWIFFTCIKPLHI
ncbi:uncharacterized protein METZ01_LOCUS515534 [marine metagenome]|uniref:Uncharacterized protein n=1 Tax=marine metagenome TaxID=408172 RepID=A0A383F2D1_9ZZZZ